MKKILLLSILALAACQHHPNANAPKASTAAVGVNLDNLGQSLGAANSSVSGIRTDLSEVDSKAVKIRNLIRSR